jgi:D-2-hydroxyacid dehydrogenase (NADP+)
MADKILLLLGRDDPQLHEQVRSLSERIVIVSPEQIRARPDLVEEIEVAYGGLGRETLPQAAKLRWLQMAGAGVNSWLTPEMRESEVIVTNASGIHAEPMFGMLLMVTRCLAQAWDQQKTLQWRGYDFGAHLDMLLGKTLGVLGVGAIGGQAAKVGQAFGMRVIGLRRGGKAHPHVKTMFVPEDRLHFFSRCDVVMNTLPLTDKTRRFMGDAEFAALPPNAIVVNAGRGATIDTEALMRALQGGKLKAALLDVTDPEPLPADHPLWTVPNVFITPHYSGGHPGYDRRADAIFLDNLRRYLNGEPLVNVVDKQEGY